MQDLALAPSPGLRQPRVHRVALCLLLAVGCRKFPAPPPVAPPGECQADTQCAHGICSEGLCDPTQCHSDAQCSSLFCYGNVDGGNPGTCGTRQCNLNTDCMTGRICEIEPTGTFCVGDCATDAECQAPEGCSINPVGKGSCGGTCRTTSDCPTSNFCIRFDGGFGNCVIGCTQDDQCAWNEVCQTQVSENGIGSCLLGCRTQSQCDAGATCELTTGNYGGCIYGGCLSDADCPGCGTCAQIGGAPGICTGGDAGPVISGVTSGLRMTDNLEPSVQFIQQVYPGAQLVEILGLGLHADGAVDISQASDYTSRWTYGFLLPGGNFASVLYYNQTHKCGLVTDPATNLSATTVIVNADVPAILDSPPLVARFVDAGCAPPQGMASDALDYLGSGDGGAYYLLSTAAGGSALGDAQTGAGTISCQ